MARAGINAVLTVPVFEAATVESLFRNTLKDVNHEIEIIQRQFNKTTATWKHKPKWTITKASLGSDNKLESKIETTSTPFVYVTLPRKRPGRAAFSRDYKPKTKPRVIGSGGGAGRVVKRGRHAPRLSNFTPREFEVVIAERRQKLYPKRAAKEIAKDFNRHFRAQGRRRTKVIPVL